MHQTVFLQLAVDYLQVALGRWYIDATFGAGGHSREIITRGGRVLAFEYDQESYQRAQENFAAELGSGQLRLWRRNFTQMHATIRQLQAAGEKINVSGILFDLGTSSDQLKSAARGLSVYDNGPLDMRLDTSLQVTAHDLIQALSEKQLIELFYHLGGELEARRIVRAIAVEKRKRGREAFQTSFELANLVARIKGQGRKIHPATKVFQALRIAVNGEIDNLVAALPPAWELLGSGGRLVTIAFHEGEDRPIKHFNRDQNLAQKGLLITKKPVVPDEEELVNPRSRSAKMRVIEKI
jgi:16S rRNA (cytosine1402-N4)-methyltransferase